MIPKFRAWSKVNVDYPEMRLVEGINYHGDGVWFNKLYDDETVPDWGYFSDIILMQSTGLFDENGVEIFEGDVVRTTRFLGRADETGDFHEYDKDFVGVVKQLEGTWVIDTGKDAVSLWTEIEVNEVIGNIYEKPDLVEVT